MTANALKFRELKERERANAANEYLKASEQNIRKAELTEQERANQAREAEAKAQRWTNFAVDVWQGLNQGQQKKNENATRLVGGLISALL